MCEKVLSRVSCSPRKGVDYDIFCGYYIGVAAEKSFLSMGSHPSIMFSFILFFSFAATSSSSSLSTVCLEIELEWRILMTDSLRETPSALAVDDGALIPELE